MFDGTCTEGCAVRMDIAVSVRGIEMNEGWTGTVEQAEARISVGAAGWTQAAGTFHGGPHSILVTGTLDLRGGEFWSCSSTLTLGQPACGTTPVLRLAPGAAFHHGQGTVINDGGRPDGESCHAEGTFELGRNLELWNLVPVGRDAAFGWHSALRVEGPGALRVLNDLDQTKGELRGEISLAGRLLVRAEAEPSPECILTFDGAGLVQRVAFETGGGTCHLVVDNGAGSVSTEASTSDSAAPSLTLRSGTFVAPSGTLSLGTSVAPPAVATPLRVAVGATFSHNRGTLRIVGSRISGDSFHGNSALDVPDRLEVNHFIVEEAVPAFGWHSSTQVLPPSTLVVLGDLTDHSEALSGRFEVHGGFVLGALASGGTASLTFVGSGAATYQSEGGLHPQGDIRIVKPSGSLQLLADWHLPGELQTFTVESGLLDSRRPPPRGGRDARARGRGDAPAQRGELLARRAAALLEPGRDRAALNRSPRPSALPAAGRCSGRAQED
ncbi:MAG: hypothetical protein QM765_51905 [Myxococcales bacterium]